MSKNSSNNPPNSTPIKSGSIMEKLLASQKSKKFNLFRGQQVEGQIVGKTDKEITLDLGTKSEGIILARDISKDKLADLKIGDKLTAYVWLLENESDQLILGLSPALSSKTPRGRRLDWSKFIRAQTQQTRLNGKVLEINKGGLIIEVDKIRGFLPNSQVGFELLSKLGGTNELVGQNLTLTVIEVDQANNKLIFSQRGKVSDEVLQKLKGFENGQKVTGKVVAMLPFGLVLDLGGVEGLVFISDVAWEKVEDLQTGFRVGQELEAQVLGIDEQLGRVNLSIKHLTEDPFAKLSEKYPADEVVKGEIVEVSEQGVLVKLQGPSDELGTGGMEGFLPVSKMDIGKSYEVGNNITVMVDSVDKNKRRINLAPFVTSTSGLIYK